MSHPSGDPVHEPAKSRFVLAMPDGRDAVLEYARSGNTVDFNHTWVPPERRGAGLASRLVAAGIAWAEREGLEARASCPYVAVWLRRRTAGAGPGGAR